MLTILTFSRAGRPAQRRRKDRDPWIEGYEARGKSRPRSFNPYECGSDCRRLWDDGWMEAQLEMLPPPLRFNDIRSRINAKPSAL